MEGQTTYVVQVKSGGRWAKVRGHEGGPWSTRDRAERVAVARENAERRLSSTEGLPHRVVEKPTFAARLREQAERETGMSADEAMPARLSVAKGHGSYYVDGGDGASRVFRTFFRYAEVRAWARENGYELRKLKTPLATLPCPTTHELVRKAVA